MTDLLQQGVVANRNWGQGGLRRLPTERYTSPEFAALERERLWPRAWQMVCRLEQLATVGDYVEYRMGKRSALLVRSGPSVVQAFENACLHRGTELRKGCGSAETITCPFHAWCWNLDGSVNHILSPEDFPGLTKEELRLPELAVAVWGGFVFVNPDSLAEPFEEFIRPLAEKIDGYRLADQVVSRYRTMTVAANWKTVLEQFEELYHAAATHPQLVPAMDDVGTAYENLGPHSQMVVPLGRPSQRVEGMYSEEDSVDTFIAEGVELGSIPEEHVVALRDLLKDGLPDGVTAREFFLNMVKMQFGERLPDLGEDQMFDNWQFTVFPNTLLNCLPGQTLVLHARPNGDDPDSAILHLISLQLLPEGTEPTPFALELVDDPVNYRGSGLAFNQDMKNTPRIQAGMHSRPFVLLAAYQEKGIANRHRVIDEYLARPGPG